MLSSANRMVSRLFNTGVASLQKAATAIRQPVTIHSIKPIPNERALQIVWTDGRKGEFSYIWLQDSAPKNRPHYLNELNLKVKPENVFVDPSGEELVIHWPPYCIQKYPSDFLRHHSKPLPKEIILEKTLRPIQWTKSTVKVARPTVKHFLESPVEVKQLFHNYGLVLLKNCLELDCVNDAIKQLVQVRQPADEVDEFSVSETEKSLHIVKESADSLHTYGPHYPVVPKYVAMLFHESADSQFQFADGFAICSQMKRSRAELFDVLLNTQVEYNNKEGTPSSQHSVVEISAVGETTQIVFNNSQRAIQANLSTVQSEVFYKALKAFHKECYEKENVFNMSIEEGDLLIFNNRRILYGHSAFTHPCRVEVTCYT